MTVNPQPTRENLASAAIKLFLAKGFERTTADEIAEEAGVARRTFFRYFRAKEDAVLPDHDGCLDRVHELLERSGDAIDPLAALHRAAHLVLGLYSHDPAMAVRRYELLHKVESLREREIMTINRYQRAFAEHLRRISPEDDPLRHDVTAAAVVAAHNHVLRQWIRDGATGDVHARLDDALQTVSAALSAWPPGDPRHEDSLVVVVASAGTPMWRIAKQLRAAAQA